MNKLSSSLALLGLALLASTQNSSAQTSIPVDHHEPITIHIVDAKNGQPLAYLHVVLAGGYDRQDLEKHIWHEDAMTDEHGVIRLPAALLNLPWLQVLTPKSNACKANPYAQIFSVERMRIDGLSTPNRCGEISVVDQPGVFTFFAHEQKQKIPRAAPFADVVAAEASNGGGPRLLIR